MSSFGSSCRMIAIIVSQIVIAMGQSEIIWQEQMTGTVALGNWNTDGTVTSREDSYCPIQYQKCWELCGDSANVASKYLYRTASTANYEQIQLVYSVSTRGMNAADASQFCELSFTTDITADQWTVIDTFQHLDRLVDATYNFGNDASDQQQLTLKIRAQPNYSGTDCCRVRDFALKGVPITTTTTTKQPTTKQPTTNPTQKPTTKDPTQQPTKQPTTRPLTTKQPTKQPTKDPTTTEPTKQPTKQPTTRQPTTKQPSTTQPTTKQPSKQPTTEPPTTKQPTTTTKQPTTKQPTTKQPTTKQPTIKPATTKQPTTKQPTSIPTRSPLRERHVYEHSTSSVLGTTTDGSNLQNGGKIFDFTDGSTPYMFVAGAVVGALLLLICGLCCFWGVYRHKRNRRPAQLDAYVNSNERRDTKDKWAISRYLSENTGTVVSKQTSVQMTHNKMAGLGRNRLFTINEGKPKHTNDTLPPRKEDLICYTPPNKKTPSHDLIHSDSIEVNNPYSAAAFDLGYRAPEQEEQQLPDTGTVVINPSPRSSMIADAKTPSVVSGTVVINPSPRTSIASTVVDYLDASGTVVINPSPRTSIASTVDVGGTVVIHDSPRTSMASTVIDVDIMDAMNASDAPVVVDTLTQIINQHKSMEKQKSYEGESYSYDEGTASD